MRVEIFEFARLSQHGIINRKINEFNIKIKNYQNKNNSTHEQTHV